MQRIVILGCPGNGKSTLARALGERLGLPILHLDTLYYGPGWKPIAVETFRKRVTGAVAGDDWIADGNFIGLAGDLTLARAEAILWLGQPRWFSMLRIALRVLTNRGRRRPDLPEGCDESVDRELVSFVWNFERVTGPAIERAIAEFAPDCPVVRLDGDRAVAAWLAGL